jgi:hypothetical protein
MWTQPNNLPPPYSITQWHSRLVLFSHFTNQLHCQYSSCVFLGPFRKGMVMDRTIRMWNLTPSPPRGGIGKQWAGWNACRHFDMFQKAPSPYCLFDLVIVYLLVAANFFLICTISYTFHNQTMHMFFILWQRTHCIHTRIFTHSQCTSLQSKVWETLYKKFRLNICFDSPKSTPEYYGLNKKWINLATKCVYMLKNMLKNTTPTFFLPLHFEMWPNH